MRNTKVTFPPVQKAFCDDLLSECYIFRFILSRGRRTAINFQQNIGLFFHQTIC